MSRQSTKKKMSNRKFLAITVPIVSLLLVLTLIINVAVNAFYDTITMYFSGSGASFESEDAESARAYAKDVALQLEQEGIVLLKNTDQTLPLSTEKTKKLAVFGWDSYGSIYGGTGSGSASTAEAITLYDALKAQGFELYEELGSVYKNYKKERQAGLNVGATDFTVYETPLSDYGDTVLNGAKEFTDTALVVFGRVGGEGNDLPTDYLKLSADETELLDWVTGNFEHVIVLLNIANAMELSFIEEYDTIDAALWIGFPGLVGMTGVAEAISGAVNPSGRLTDIYVTDLTKDPTYYNSSSWGVKEYTDQSRSYYIDYCEGIYMGYRYYETAAVEGYIDYNLAVVYPFGYGLSYTSFEQSIKNFKVNDDTVTVEVEVKNTGNTAGKEVVQIYFTAPYDSAEKIEKAYVELIGYEKTELLSPGASETVTVEFHVADMAAYDYINAGAYVLSAGDYEIKLMKNSHDVIDSRTCTIDKKIVYNEDNDGARKSDDAAAENRFADADGSGESVPVEYMTREDMTLPQEKPARAASAAVKASQNSTYEQDNSLTDITTGVNSGLTLADMVGLAYSDTQWDTFLNQLTFKEMAELSAYGGYSTIALDSVGKVATIDLDGPNGFNESNTTTGGGGGIAYPCETVIASTWNNKLAETWGESLGNEAKNYGVSGWYAPGTNIHRSAFGGRNFEYFSEDPLLSGKMAANTIAGAAKYGLYCYVKHFAVNETETHRCDNGLYTWVNEQAMREIYLQPFEIAVKEGGTTAIMSSFNRIGATWAGASHALLTEVLREEWGFHGMVLSDYYMSMAYPYMDPYAGLVAGNDIWLAGVPVFGQVVEDKDITIRNAVRNAAHNILYTVANSNVYDASCVVEETSDSWIVLLYIIDAVLAVFIVGLTVFMVRRTRKHRNYILAIIEERKQQ
ncbi:MAG: glycoside hydrolase family 3 C-terminal domain-containing protein [Lachnospiraceae bacterium]